jgi:hypothetical protein
MNKGSSLYRQEVALAVRASDRLVVNLLAAKRTFLAEAYHEHDEEANRSEKKADYEPSKPCAAIGANGCADDAENEAGNEADNYSLGCFIWRHGLYLSS